jgi:NADH-quinone oxidoreductase subunit J
MESILFLIGGGVALLSALMVVFQRDTLYSALFLILAFLALAVLYLALGAEFIAFVQVIVNAGAVMVLFLFVIMMLNPEKEQGSFWKTFRGRKILGGGLVLFILLLLGLAISAPLYTSPARIGTPGSSAVLAGANSNNTKALASLLFTDYLLPFEITSVLLLVAVVGVVYLSGHPRKENKIPKVSGKEGHLS